VTSYVIELKEIAQLIIHRPGYLVKSRIYGYLCDNWQSSQ